MTIGGIAPFIQGSRCRKRLGKTLSTVSMIIKASAWITHMDHTLHNQCMQHWLCFRIRNLSSNDLVNVITIPWLVLILYPNQDMSMGNTTLLKLNDMTTSNGFSTHPLLIQSFM